MTELQAKTPIRELAISELGKFHAEIVPSNQPVVVRGLAADWPSVRAACVSDAALCAYLLGFDSGQPITTAFGPPNIGGRFFYNHDLSGMNFQSGQSNLARTLDYITTNCGAANPPAVAIQSALIPTCLPGFEDENRLDLVPNDVAPRLWIGGPGIIAPHYDPSENLAVCVAGKRRFTLFPTHTVSHLYTGPFEPTPAGMIISLAEMENWDQSRFPSFEKAIEEAQFADLEPGDAIFVPYLWWHHVRARAPLNMLVNYWWHAPEQMCRPSDALTHAILAIRALPPHQRARWREIFQHFVFNEADLTPHHIAESRRGILGQIAPHELQRQKQRLAQVLSVKS